jgi:SAM-dependent methyltransferase
VRSARHVVPVVLDATGARSIADFGCGLGAWLSVWREAGLEVQGVDGPYVDMAKLLIDPDKFIPADLAMPIDLGRRFDLVQSLETAEHLPESAAVDFVASLVRHADRVLFSAAVPGQGGEHHIHERPLDYWRALFRGHGYVAVDIVRPAMRGMTDVQIWYRCNTILYVHQNALEELSGPVKNHVVADGDRLGQYWPLKARFQQQIVRHLPVKFVDFLSALNARRSRP